MDLKIMLNEKLGDRLLQFSHSSVSDIHSCSTPLTNDSGNYSGYDFLVSTGDDAFTIEKNCTSSCDDQNKKQICSEQSIKKLKNELLFLKRSERWYKNELKIQKRCRRDTLEKLYVNEVDFLKTNQSLNLECQKLRALCVQIKSKSKKEKERLLKQIKVISNNDVANGVCNDDAKYSLQKLNKAVEVREALIEILKKQKQALLIDLKNLNAEKDEKIMLIEKKMATFEKENCMLVDKCKYLILENQKLQKFKEKFIASCAQENHETNKTIREFKTEILNINEIGYEGNEEVVKIGPKFNGRGTNNCKLDKNEIKTRWLNTNEGCRRGNEHVLSIRRLCDILKTENVFKYETEKNDFEQISEVVNQIVILGKRRLNSGIGEDFEMGCEKLLKICFDYIEQFNKKINLLQQELDQGHGASKTLDEMASIFDEDTFIAKVIYNADTENTSSEVFTFDFEVTLRKNELLQKLISHNHDLPLILTSNIKKVNDIIKDYNNFCHMPKRYIANLIENESNLKTDANCECSNHQNETIKFCSFCSIGNFKSLKQLNQLLTKQKTEHEHKLSSHQSQIRFLLNQVASTKKKLENLGIKYEIVLKKNQNFEKEIIQNRTENHENFENHTVLGTSKIELFHNRSKKVTYPKENDHSHLNLIDSAEKLDDNLKSNLTNLMDDYKAIMKTQKNLYKPIKQNKNFMEIYDLIEKSNNISPNMGNIFEIISKIKEDVDILKQRDNQQQIKYRHSHSFPVSAENNLSILLKQEEPRSLMNELQELKYY